MEGQWWNEEIAKDIHETLKNSELLLPSYRACSPQLGWRRYFVDLLASVSRLCNLSSATLHLSVYMLDLFMENNHADDKLLYIVSITCLILASKFEERDNVPSLEQLNRITESWHIDIVLTKSDLLKMELWFLGKVDWNLCLPTAVHFIGYYLLASVTESERNCSWLVSHGDVARAIVEEYSRYFLHLSLKDHVFRSFPPSLIAAACVCASRVCLMFCPHWTPELKKQTGYSLQELAVCIPKLVKAYEKETEDFNNMQVLESLATQRLPSQVLFQQASYQPLAENSYASAQFCSPVVDLFFAYRASLLAPQPPSGLAPEHSSHSFFPLTSPLPSYPTLQAIVQHDFPSLSAQPVVFLQVPLPADPRYCLPLILGSSFFIQEHSHTSERSDE